MQKYWGSTQRCFIGDVQTPDEERKNRVCTILHFFKKLVCLVFITMHDSHIVCFPFLMRFLPKRGQLGSYYTT